MIAIASKDESQIWVALNNPWPQKARMPMKASCFGCTHLDEFAYDRTDHMYRPYCRLFDVWNNFKTKHRSAEIVEIYPNEVCNYHVRSKFLRLES